MNSRYNWTELGEMKAAQGKYLFLLGGTYSPDRGCPEWGSNRDADTFYPGDEGGSIVLFYTDGTKTRIPLIFGYTLWYGSFFAPLAAPFSGQEKQDCAAELLSRTLMLKGGCAYESPYILCVRPEKALAGIAVEGSPQKEGMPLYTHFCPCEETDDDFFASHTVDAADPLPLSKVRDLGIINRILYTYDPSDFVTVPRFEFPKEYNGAQVRFDGDSLARIATGVFYENAMQIYNKTEDNGKVHESSCMAPTWRYNGFGTWQPGAGSYYSQMYTRNHHSVSVLSRLGFTQKADAAIKYSTDCMMYFRREGLTLGGKPIPGHWSAVCDDPMFYSKVLRHAGWYTKYTEEAFGSECDNLGNFEVDGHGFAMLAIYNVWKSEGARPEYVTKNLETLKEPVDFIAWCLDNPELSFSERGLLYGETEAGLADIRFGAGMKITMYGNIACCLGVRAYSLMARAAGLYELADRWLALSRRLETAIFAYFSKGEGWDLENRGFYHDSALPTYSDYAGYDPADFPAKWYERSLASYEEDKADYIGGTFIGPRGIGYDHCIFTQTALLLDRVKDYSRLMKNLCRLCYAPRLPWPYIVPECASYSPEKQLFRRQGDLGNLAHQAEAVHTFMTVIGLCGSGRSIKWIPRLPEGWSLDARRFPVPGRGCTADIQCDFPVHGVQRARFAANAGENGACEEFELIFRAGPFAKGSGMACSINGENVPCAAEEYGEAAWGRICFTVKPGAAYEICVRSENERGGADLSAAV